jgi:hypothetical protein
LKTVMEQHFRQTRGAKKTPKTNFKARLKFKETTYIYYGFRKLPCGLIPKPLNKGIYSVFGRFIVDKIPDVLGTFPPPRKRAKKRVSNYIFCNFVFGGVVYDDV